MRFSCDDAVCRTLLSDEFVRRTEPASHADRGCLYSPAVWISPCERRIAQARAMVALFGDACPRRHAGHERGVGAHAWGRHLSPYPARTLGVHDLRGEYRIEPCGG